MQIKIKWFSKIDNFDSLKSRYKDLVKRYHPDLDPSNLEAMKAINSEYDYLISNLAKITDKTIDREVETQFKEIIEEFTKLEVEIEICGSWLWLHGDTKPIKDKLKELKCYWAPNKKLWYWRPVGSRTYSKSNFTMAEIRAKYGSHYTGTSKKYIA